MTNKIEIIIESASSEAVFGRTNYDDNLIVASSKSLEALIKKMKQLLNDFHQLNAESIEFEIKFDTTA
jgi:hypothetical protein